MTAGGEGWRLLCAHSAADHGGDREESVGDASTRFDWGYKRVRQHLCESEAQDRTRTQSYAD